MQSTQEQRDRVYQLRIEEGKSWKSIREEFPDIVPATLRRIAHREKKKRERAARGEEPLKQPVHKVEFKRTGDKAEAFSKSERIKTLEQLLAAAKVDLDVWHVARYSVNSWGQAQKNPKDPKNPILVTLHQVKAFLERNRVQDSKDRIDDLREDMRAFSPVYPVIKRPERRGPAHLYELAVPDVHLGKAAWAMETGGTYNMNIAEGLFRDALRELAALASGFEIEQILLPLGNDLMHVDGLKGTTSRGTAVFPEGSGRQHFRRVRYMIREAVDKLVQVAPVKLIFIPGNHDEAAVFYLNEALADWYHRNPNVEVVNSAMTRQYIRFGCNLLGFVHGHQEKHNDLPMLMAAEVPELWAKTTVHEFHMGHYHVKKETKYLPVHELGGVRLRILPSLSAADAWHNSKGYTTGVRAAEGYLWNREKGLTAQFSWLPDA